MHPINWRSLNKRHNVIKNKINQWNFRPPSGHKRCLWLYIQYAAFQAPCFYCIHFSSLNLEGMKWAEAYKVTTASWGAVFFYILKWRVGFLQSSEGNCCTAFSSSESTIISLVQRCPTLQENTNGEIVFKQVTGMKPLGQDWPRIECRVLSLLSKTGLLTMLTCQCFGWLLPQRSVVFL